MGTYVTCLPIVVVVWVLHHLIPKRYLTLKIFSVSIGKRTHVQKEAVTVRVAVYKTRWRIRSWLGSRQPKRGEEIEGMGKKQRAVMMKIIANKPIGDGRLR